MSKFNTRPNYPLEVRERAVRMMLKQAKEHPSQWSNIASIVPKIGCTPQTPLDWVRRDQRDQGMRAGLTTGDASV